MVDINVIVEVRMLPDTDKNQTNTTLPLILLTVGIALVIGVLVWAFSLKYHPGSSQALSANTTSNRRNETQFGNTPYPDIQRVSVTDAKKAFDTKSAVFVDVRPVTSYQARHIAGAKSLPLSEIPSHSIDIGKSTWIITYCT